MIVSYSGARKYLFHPHIPLRETPLFGYEVASSPKAAIYAHPANMITPTLENVSQVNCGHNIADANNPGETDENIQVDVISSSSIHHQSSPTVSRALPAPPQQQQPDSPVDIFSLLAACK